MAWQRSLRLLNYVMDTISVRRKEWRAALFSFKVVKVRFVLRRLSEFSYNHNITYAAQRLVIMIVNKWKQALDNVWQIAVLDKDSLSV